MYEEDILLKKAKELFPIGTKFIDNNGDVSYVISRSDFKKLYDVSCTGWKNKLSELIEETIGLFNNVGVLTQSQVMEMYKVISNHSQRKTFEDVFPSFTIFETLDELKGHGDYFATGKVRLKNAPLLGIRNQGEYKDCAFALDKRFNWELKVDSLGIKVLIPTRKK